jgi:predicted RNase H-like nuclease (RuvC/YqgF family)
MTKEPIMIDGVDVLNCGYFSQFEGKTENACYIQPRKVIGSDVNISFGSCDTSPNCYYKQLKRKEQECERLKNIINEAKNSKLDLNSFLVGEAIQNEYEEQLDQLKAENEHLAEKEEEARHYLEEAFKLKQALQDIKSLCLEQNLKADFFACEILQKCEDVL